MIYSRRTRLMCAATVLTTMTVMFVTASPPLTGEVLISLAITVLTVLIIAL
ncbi:hypothetical protein [Pseudomonas sp. RT6P73]